MKKILFAACMLFAVACSSSRHAGATQSTSASTPANPSADGSSFEKAIVIQEKAETAGIAAEYKWIRDNYPGSKRGAQSLANHDKKPYDILTIVTADGIQKKIYFDISNFFGKF